MSGRYDRLQEDTDDSHENIEPSSSEGNQTQNQNETTPNTNNTNNNTNNTTNNNNIDNESNRNNNIQLARTGRGLSSQPLTALRNLALPNTTTTTNNNENNNDTAGNDTENNTTGPLTINFNNETNGANAVINLNARDFSQSEIDSLSKILRYLLPALLILSLLFIYEHIIGIIFYLWITSVLQQANSIIKHQASQRDQRRIPTLLSVDFLLVILVIGIYLIFWQESLWMYLIFMKPSGPPLSFWDCIWVIVVADAVIKVASMLLKSLYMICLSRIVTTDTLGKLCSFTELFSQFHRTLISVPVWLRFFTNNYFNIAFASICTGLYLAFKLYTIYTSAIGVFLVVQRFLKRGPRYGKYASPEEVAEYGEDECPICRDTFHRPVAFNCGHIFCEECINQWLERESTCPMCRENIKPHDIKKTYTDGSTDMSVRIF